ncbi:Ig-like domain-containing protein [Pedococcus sp. NPDC057267]|uniref:Ig-like domain-containing protein n=1 Tax=Pedococcus sp. NPDC057267 TaxID=3346077 RepID=UPI0036326D96
MAAAAAGALSVAGLAWLAASARAATLTPPDLKILVPTSSVSIGLDGTTGHRMLRFTHITEDAGTGPFELDPTYTASTGVSTFVQTIYNSPSPGTWAVDHTVPLAVNGVFSGPDDYQFPLTRFTLDRLNADGSVGAAVATSPKSDYCMTGDYRVGDVPNTPAQTSPPVSNCGDPTRPLGWSVGWGDQYDQTDAGQPIDLTGVADGTYVLRATVDPLHALTESDVTNDVTDTRLTITGTTVAVGAQTHPVLALPAVTVTSPADGATVSGNVTLAVTASAVSPATVSSVQYLLDGNPLGVPVTTAPYTSVWTVGTTPAGTHRISARATDSAGNVRTAAVVQVQVAGAAPPVTATGTGTTTTPAFPVSAGQTVLALVSSDGPAAAGAQSVVVSGGGLTWTRVVAANAEYGDSEVWAAHPAAAASGVRATSTPSAPGFDQQVVVMTFDHTSTVGASAHASAPSGAPAVTLVSTSSGSRTLAVGNDWDAATPRVLATGQSLLAAWVDTGVGDTFWAQQSTAVSTAAGQSVRLADTGPTTDRWNLAAVEVPAAAGVVDTTPPTVTVTNPVAGQTVSGTVPVAATASDDQSLASVQFLLDGAPLGAPVTSSPYAVQWDTTKATAGTHTISARAVDGAGNSAASAGVVVTVQNPAPPMTCFVLQAHTTAHSTTGSATTPALSTAMPGEVLLAFVSADGPSGAAAQSSTVSGAGLAWKLVARANAQYGDSEIWTATAATVLSGATVTSTLAAPGYHQALSVIALEGAAGTGAKGTASAATGAAHLGLVTTSATSLVFAVGNDWDSATARSLPVGEVLLDQWLDTGTGDTDWSEYTNATTGPAGTTVAMGTTAPTTDRWNLAAVEVTNAG